MLVAVGARACCDVGQGRLTGAVYLPGAHVGGKFVAVEARGRGEVRQGRFVEGPGSSPGLKLGVCWLLLGPGPAVKCRKTGFMRAV